ncbi:MAG: uroporphyrinogen-III synthase [Pseudomonadota bacterium]
MLLEKEKPLLNKIIVTTRQHSPNDPLILKLTELGAKAFAFPTIKTEIHADENLFIKTISTFDDYHSTIFTSANAVKYFFELLNQKKLNPNLQSKLFCVIGDSTEKTLKAHIKNPTLIKPKEACAESILELYKSLILNKNEKILYIRPKTTRELLCKGFAKIYLSLDELVVYKTIFNCDESLKQKLENMLKNNQVNLVTFTSPSTFNNFMKIFPECLLKKAKGLKIASIGAVTKNAIEQKGLIVDIVPDIFNIDSLLEAILLYYSK